MEIGSTFKRPIQRPAVNCSPSRRASTTALCRRRHFQLTICSFRGISVVFQDLLFFVATDNSSASSQSLYYINDATHTGTAERIDLNFTALNTPPVVVNDKLFLLSTKEDNSLELNILDSNLTLTLLQDFDESYYVTAMNILGDSVVFGLNGQSLGQ